MSTLAFSSIYRSRRDIKKSAPGRLKMGMGMGNAYGTLLIAMLTIYDLQICNDRQVLA